MGVPWRILVVDDDRDIAENLRELISPAAVNEAGDPPNLEVEVSFDTALETLVREEFDLLVLDVRNQVMEQGGWSPADTDRGLEVYESIRCRRFIPIVFYTALPHLVEGLDNSPFVQVVSKLSNERVQELRQAVVAAFDSGFPRLHRALRRHVEALTREFMIEFVEKHWSELQDHRADVAYLLTRRLGISFEGGASQLASELGYPPDDVSGEVVHPTRFYVALPSHGHRMGDVLRGPDARLLHQGRGDSRHWYVILTPSCDLVTHRPKADRVVLAECLPIDNFDHYQEWIEEGQSSEGASVTKRKQLERLLTSRPIGLPEDRYHYLPAAFDVPDLIVDNQRIVHISFEHLSLYTRVASLDSPYAEELSHRFHRYMGRLGTPDLDMQTVLRRMEVSSSS